MYELLKTAANKKIVISALKVSLVVGLLLNAINQGAALIEWHQISWGHVVMNFLVPYGVASYSAAKNEMNP